LPVSFSLCFEHVEHWERIASRGRPAFSFHLVCQFWPNQNPLGQQIVIGNGLGPRFKDVPRQIIGIVGNTHDVDLSTPPAPAMIIPQAQVSNDMTAFWSQFGPAYWLVRTR
jgi:putative ABC transport system permease protein